MNKKIIIIIFVVITTVILSGCNVKTKNTSNDGGIYKTTDFAENWVQKSFISKTEDGVRTIGKTNTNFMIFDPIDKDTIYLSTVGNGIYKTTNSGDQWSGTTLASGTYRSISIDTLNNDVVYVTDGLNIKKTIDNLNTWNDIYVEKRPGQSIIGVIVDRFKPNIIYTATTSSILKSYDYGNSWELLDWSGNGIIRIYQSEINPSVLYIWTNSGIYKSVNNALDWTLVSEELSSFSGGDIISWFHFDPTTEFMILGTNYGIIRSVDGGTTWDIISTLFDFKSITIKPVIFLDKDWQKFKTMKKKSKIDYIDVLRKNYNEISDKADFIFTASDDLLEIFMGHNNSYWITDPNEDIISNFNWKILVSEMLNLIKTKK